MNKTILKEAINKFGMQILENTADGLILGLEATFTTINKLIKKSASLLVQMDDTYSVAALETFFANAQQPDDLFFLLREKKKYHKDTSSIESIYIHMLETRRFHPDSTFEFCEALDKNISYIFLLYLKDSASVHAPHTNKKFNYLLEYLGYICKQHSQYLDDIVKLVISEYKETYNELFFEIARIILSFDNKYMNQLIILNSKSIQSDFEKYLSQHSEYLYSYIMYPAINYFHFLNENHPNHFSKFEKVFLQHATSKQIYNYAITFKKSNKRAILKKLVKHNDERTLIDFIESFPQYKLLLPML